MRLRFTAAGAAALACATFGSLPASAAEAPGAASAPANVAQQIVAGGTAVDWSQWRGRRGGFRRGFYGPRGGYGYRRGFYGRGYGYRRGYHRNGALVGAGIAGLATGALIGGALAAQAAPEPGVAVNPEWLAYCSNKYKSFDPASGTYLGYDGQRHPCQ